MLKIRNRNNGIFIFNLSPGCNVSSRLDRIIRNVFASQIRRNIIILLCNNIITKIIIIITTIIIKKNKNSNRRIGPRFHKKINDNA
jgi:hypothetical protein